MKPWSCFWRDGGAIRLYTVEEDLSMEEVTFVFAMLRIAFAQLRAEA